MELKYKVMKEFDLNQIKEIYQACMWKSYLNNDEQLLESFNSSIYIYGAYSENKLIGFIRSVGDIHHIVLVQDLIVHPDFQEKGIGTQLLKHVIDKYQNSRMFIIITDLEDERDNKFYQKFGFKKIIEKKMITYIR